MTTRNVYKFVFAVAGVIGLLLLVQAQAVQAGSNLRNGGDYLPDGGEIFEDDGRSELDMGYQAGPIGDVDVHPGGFTQASAAGLAVIRVMPLGDSITKGYPICSDHPGPSLDCTGYREDLWNSLVGAGHSVEFVGGLGAEYQYQYSYDNDHEGHGGKTAGFIKDNVYGYLVDNPADIVLLHIGTNNFSGSPPYDPDDVVADVNGILNRIDNYENNKGKEVWVILAKIIKRLETTEKEQAVEDFNDALQTMANGRISGGDKIFVVDMESALNYPDDLPDELHPNTTGYSKMAAVWFAAIEQVIIMKFDNRIMLPMVIR